MPDVIRLGTRTTPLALWQAEHVASCLRRAWPEVGVELVTFVTEGDRRLAQPLPEIGGKGVFTAELEAALHAGTIDIAVHSLKDLPVQQPDGLMLGAILTRADARDAWYCPGGTHVSALPRGARVGTSSLRRQAQLLALHPNLSIEPIRGSVGRRLEKVQQGDYEATVLALAGLQRLGLDQVVTSVFDFDTMLPAPGQAALAVQCRTEGPVQSRLRAIDDPDTRQATTAERAFLYALGGGCSAPIGAIAHVKGDTIYLRAGVFSLDGTGRVLVRASGTRAAAVGEAAAAQAIRDGAHTLLGD